jgi:hypothetical protein
MMPSEFLKVKGIVEVLKKYFPELNDERAVYIAYDILFALVRLEHENLES